MVPENSVPNRYWYGPYEGYAARSRHRLQQDLGIDEAATETILHLRNQVVALQSRIRELEAELNAQTASKTLRLARYQEVSFEATWIEVNYPE